MQPCCWGDVSAGGLPPVGRRLGRRVGDPTHNSFPANATLMERNVCALGRIHGHRERDDEAIDTLRPQLLRLSCSCRSQLATLHGLSRFPSPESSCQSRLFFRSDCMRMRKATARTTTHNSCCSSPSVLLATCETWRTEHPLGARCDERVDAIG
jgi:hypothetical protein